MHFSYTHLFILFTLSSISIPLYFGAQLSKSPLLRTKKLMKESASRCIFLLSLLLFLCFLFQTKTPSFIHTILSEGIFAFCVLSLYRLHTESPPIRERPLQIRLKFRRILAFMICLTFSCLWIHIMNSIGGPLFSWISFFTFLILSTPVIVRLFHPSLPMHDSPFKKELFSIFMKANEPRVAIYILASQELKRANGFICGTRWGRGPFQRSLFLSESLFSLLNCEEIKAVVAHEASHLLLHHPKQRIFKSLFYALLSFLFVMIPASLIFLSLPKHSLSLIALFSSVMFFTFFIQTFFTHRMIRLQEYAADRMAVAHFHCSKDALLMALKKMTLQQRQSLQIEKNFIKRFFVHTHPAYEEREAMLLGRQSFPIESLSEASDVNYRRRSYG